jgi:hypothetical protein
VQTCPDTAKASVV